MEKVEPPGKAGMRSLLRVAIRIRGEVVGVLDFGSFKRAAIVCEGGLITGEHLALPRPLPDVPPVATAAAPPPVDGGNGRGSSGDLKTMERAAIERALREARQNKSKAARLLGLTRTQLYVRLRKYGID